MTETADGPTRELDDDIENLRGALAWCQVANPEAGLRLITATRQVWWRKSRVEGRRWAHLFLERRPDPTVTRARGLNAAGILEAMVDAASTQRRLTDALVLATSLDDRVTIGMSESVLGWTSFLQDDPTAGIPHLERALGPSQPSIEPGPMSRTTQA